MLAVARAHVACAPPSTSHRWAGPLVIQGLFRQFAELNKEGVTMFVVEQNANLALGVAHRAYVLEAGQIVLSGAADELKSDDSVRRAYLGF
jgi:branched-chain amino acid transport system ATP-binding protein